MHSSKMVNDIANYNDPWHDDTHIRNKRSRVRHLAFDKQCHPAYSAHLTVYAASPSSPKSLHQHIYIWQDTHWKMPSKVAWSSRSDRVKNEWRAFVVNSTFHGLPGTSTAPFIWMRIAWTILFVAAVGVSLWQIGTFLKKYIDKPIETEVEVCHCFLCTAI